MDIQTLTDEIRHKLNHVVSTKIPSYLKTLENESDEEKEANVSLYVTDLTFQVSNKIIKEKLSRFNPKPIEFTFHMNRAKYFEQTIRELMVQVNQEVYFDEEAMKKKKIELLVEQPFQISFCGHFLKDYGYIGTKHIEQTKEISEQWFPAILSCLRVTEEDPKEAEEMLSFIKKFVLFGFEKALNMKYVFIDMVKMDENLASVDFVSIQDVKMTAEEFIQYRAENILGKK